MTLTFNAIHRTGQVGFAGKKSLEGEAFLIGRGPANDWILPDEDCIVSKQHCVVEDSGGAFVLRDTSTNGVFLNGALVGRDNCRSLADGDCIEIGPFAFRIEIEDDAPLAELEAFAAQDSDITPPSIALASGDDSEITGGGMKTLLDDIAANAGTASSILPGINDTSLPKNADLQRDRHQKLNSVGWDEPPAVKPISDDARQIDAVAEVALERALMPSMPQREDTPGLETVVQLATASAILPDDWNSTTLTPVASPTIVASPTTVATPGPVSSTDVKPQQPVALVVQAAAAPSENAATLVQTFVRAANLPEAEVARLTAEIESGRLTAQEFFAHAGGMLRQASVAIEERLSTCRSKVQSLEYTVPEKALEPVRAILDRAEPMSGAGPADVTRDLGSTRIVQDPARSNLTQTIEQMRLLDAALFTTLLSVAALSFGAAAAGEDEEIEPVKKAG